MNERVGEWMNEWMNEWTNERMNIWHRACSGPFSTVLWASWLRGIHWWQSFFSHTLAAMARRLPLSSLVTLPASRCFPATNIIAGLAASASTERTPSAWMLRSERPALGYGRSWPSSKPPPRPVRPRPMPHHSSERIHVPRYLVQIMFHHRTFHTCMIVIHSWVNEIMNAWMQECKNACMFVCMFVCMHGCMDVRMYVCMDGWMDGWFYGCMDVWMDGKTYGRMYRCMDVCMYWCMGVRMYVCTYVWMYGKMYVWLYGCMGVWLYVCMYVCISNRRVWVISSKISATISHVGSSSQVLDGKWKSDDVPPKLGDTCWCSPSYLYWLLKSRSWFS